ncbi:NUDIX hydrolase [Alsobacter soli]|uniref:NUDIX hydrolase n=2 Tax=Alsobacter soli TaxID=2109933 RepID=A0A2T1HUY9_9HYPH|nr:NUDIX hydrolase [Alsobacter soli]
MSAMQFAALPYRVVEGRTEVLLVTSRETRRWVIPKGWPMKGKRPHQAATREAFEEAGVKGEAAPAPVGGFTYWKKLGRKRLLCTVEVFLMAVTAELKVWPERRQRKRRWFPAEEAAAQVEEPGLAAIIRESVLSVPPEPKSSSDQG